MRYAILTMLLIACNGKDTGTDTRVADIQALTGDSANGATLFADNCAVCHGADGSGGSGPSLVDELPSSDEEEMLDFILNGEEEMPSFADWEDQDIADVLAYLVETFQ